MSSGTPSVDDSSLIPNSSLDNSTSHCGMCNEPKTQKMVTCLECHVSFHFECIKFRSEKGVGSYICRDCRKAKKPTKTSENIAKRDVDPNIEIPPTVSRTLQQCMSMNSVAQESTPPGESEAQESTSCYDSNTDKSIKPGTSCSPTSIDKVKTFEQHQQANISDEGLKTGKLKKPSSTSSSKQRALALAKLNEEMEFRKKLQAEYLERKYEILEESSADESECQENSTKNWVEDHRRSRVSFRDEDVTEDTRKALKEPLLVDNLNTRREGVSGMSNKNLNQPSLHQPVPWLSASSQDQFLNSTSLIQRDEFPETSRRDMHFRNPILRDLPHFNGDPAD